MKRSNSSDFANYIVMADYSGLSPGYETFLRFQEVKAFINQIASKNGDTFLHNGTIYKKKITSTEARSMLDGFFQNRCNVSKLRIVANQLKIRM